MAQVHVWKCRFSWVGKQGQANLIYDVATTKYREVQLEDTPFEERDKEEFKL